MIQSIFLLSPTGEVIIERHFRGVVTSRSVCDTFWDRASLSVNHHGGLSTTTSILLSNDSQQAADYHYDTAPPVMEVPCTEQGTLYVISILRDGLSYLAVCPAEVSPLLLLEFLHRIANIFIEYFGSPADETTIKENFSTVYQLLEEMVDYGWPLTTEPNALKAMIRPPTVMSRLLSSHSSTITVSDELPSGTISNMPWRAAGVTYTQNEIYMDIVEEVDAIVNGSGSVISSDVSGSIQCQSHLSGIPDLLLTFKDPSLIDDCSFHPCVRYARFENDHVVSFVPPDGNFELMKYRIRRETAANFVPPIYCHTQWSIDPSSSSSTAGPDKTMTSSIGTTATTMATSTSTHSETGGGSGGQSTGKLSLQLGTTTLSSLIFSASRKGPLLIEDVAVTIPFPKTLKTISDFHVTIGSIVYDEAGKVAKWTIGKIDATKKMQLSVGFTLNHKSSSHPSTKTTTSSSSSAAIASIATATTAATSIRTNNKNSTTPIMTHATKWDTSSSTLKPNLSLSWKIPLSSVSGLSVSGLSVTGANYRPYKGVRNITKSGVFQIRCS